jgi:hypothetical protein
MLYLLAEQSVVDGVPEPIGNFSVNHLDLLNYCVLQLAYLR